MTLPPDPGATPTGARALAPDLARGGMLLLIALANVHAYTYGHSLGPRGYPADPGGIDAIVALLQMLLVDGRAYPMFGLLFGYGIVQLARRRTNGPDGTGAAVGLVRRRGTWMVAIGAAHGLLLWSGDIVAAYGLVALLTAGLLLRGSDRALVRVVVAGTAFVGLFYAFSGLPLPGDPQAFLPSMAIVDPAAAAAVRGVEWLGVGVVLQVPGTVGAVAAGAWAARRRLLDEPGRHRALLVRVAVVGMAAAVLGGLPLALVAAGYWTSPPLAGLLAAGALHAVGGYAGGFGYAAVFGLLAVRIARRGAGPVAGALRACGQRSLSCYLAQSVAFVALLPAWTLGLGARAHLWQVALLGAGAWLVILVVAAVSARAGVRGPAEVLLRRLTYGPRRVPVAH
ncbi:DUF418 domain-containing protein [Pseudonocardia humida]|uniref:DUF418 domain-containing protein n=1 Tax=Pseudonocardia humida TaxID=2800819 RepID=A0ABT0ZT44_9PSEU|nr:DUF418 domain-containing protein [Pseudonocardia humida]MCO1653887.1 DUF418 domain-containing protein [Pseudonocardia humida]